MINRICVKYFSYLTIFFVIISTQIFGQTRITGKVTDTLSNPISFAQVLLKAEGSNNIISFSQTNSNGIYFINVKQPGKYLLLISSLSFQPLSIPLEIEPNQKNNSLILNATLSACTMEIKELVFHGNIPIIVKKDTIVYKAIAFSRGDEKVAEDILKRIPGIDVDKTGIVKYNGKEVEKIMIEGDDLFGKGYNLVSKNLHANVINKVEIYQHYSENSLLKNIEESDKVALNLTLNDNDGIKLFGNATMGYSTDKKHELRTTLMSFRVKTKLYFFGNSNKLGYDPVGSIGQFINSIDEKDLPQNDYKPDFIINLKEIGQHFNDQRDRFKNSHMASLNSVFSPSDKIKIKLISFFTLESEDFFRNGFQKFTSVEVPFTLTENYKLYDKLKSGFLKTETTFRPNNVILILYKGQYIVNNGNCNSSLSYNLNKTREFLHSNVLSSDQTISITKKLKGSNALLFNARYKSDYRTEYFFADTFQFKTLVPNFYGIKEVNQDISQSINYGILEAKSINRIKEKLVFENRFGLTNSRTYLKSNIYCTDSLGELRLLDSRFRNDIFLGSTKLSLGTKLIYKFSVVSLQSSLDANYLFVSTNFSNFKNEEKYKYLEPKLGIGININEKNNIQLNYAYNTSFTSLIEIAKGLIITDYRTLQSSTEDFSLLKGHSMMVNYFFGSPMDKTFMNASAIYSVSNNYLTSNSLIGPEFSMLTKTRGHLKEMLIISSTNDFYISPFSCNIKLKGNISDFKYDYVVNNNTKIMNSVNSLIGMEIRSAFECLFNFHFGTSWTKNIMKGNKNYRTLNNYQFLKLYFLLNPRLRIEFQSDRYFFGNIVSKNNPWFFLDANVKYDLIPKQCSISFSAYNLLDNREFGQYVVSDIGVYSSQFRIVPRSLFFSIDYRF